VDFAEWTALLDRPEIRFDPAWLQSAIQGRRVWITGAGGSIGSRLAQTVLAFGPAELTLIDAHEASLVRLAQKLGTSAARYLLADVRDRRKLDHSLRRAGTDVVFHLAAYKHVPLAEGNVDQVFATNVLGALSLLEACAAHGVGTVVYPSTDKVVQPPSVYGATKRIVEQSWRALAGTWSAPAVRLVRLVNVFGTQGSVVETFARQIRTGEAVTVTDDRMDRYWITMAEAVGLLLAAAARPHNDGVYLLDVGAPVPIVETARRVFAVLRPGEAGPAVRLTGIRPGERLHEYLHDDTEQVCATGVPGLLAVVGPPPAAAASWLAALEQLRSSLYEWEPSSLRERLFALAAGQLTERVLDRQRP
jgi:O-antigen biosynthesis protein WbqV